MHAPEFPIGPYAPSARPDADHRAQCFAALAELPRNLRDAVAGLTPPQLDTRYRNWTVRQIAHHLADSHLNAYTRTKLAITEDTPTIKPYQEGPWSALPDARDGDVEPSLQILEGLHARWVAFYRSLGDAHFDRAFFHPEQGRNIAQGEALTYYAWHCRHHVGQIRWLRQHHGW